MTERRAAFVTGGSRGIGRAICVELARRGYKVGFSFRSNQEAAKETLDQIAKAGPRGIGFGFDVSKPETCEQKIKEFVDYAGRIDVLVNNAGISRDALLMRVKEDDFSQSVATNVGGTLWMCKAVIRYMGKAKFGRIINIASVVGETGNAGQTVYSGTKAAVIGMTKSMAKEYARRGITCNIVAPGYIETDMTKSLPEQARFAALEKTPVGRIGTPEEIASAVAFLASDEAGFITGEVLRVNGGMHI